jgi:hypothetical protein
MAPNIDLSVLLPSPLVQQTESVNDFIRKSAIHVLKSGEPTTSHDA